MNTLRHLKGNFIISGTAIATGLLSKHFLKKEFIPVSSSRQMTKSYFFILVTTIIGKITMDKFYEKYWISLPIEQGKPKVENEGFIGPLHGDPIYLMGPNRWDNRANIFRWAPEDQHIQ